jgi:hypothetical protein
VVGPDNETHDVRHLFVCDGSAVPGPLGVNPQMTIMALSERAAEHVGRRAEEAAARAAAGRRSAQPADPQRGSRDERRLAFAEVMAGTLTWPSGDETPVEVRVRAELPLPVRLCDLGVDLRVAGTLDVPPIAREVRCEGRLAIRPLRLRQTLLYDLTFDADGAWRLVGEKHVAPWRAARGLTTLHVRLLAPDGTEAAKGVMRFDVRSIPTWAASWRIAGP